MPTPAHELRLVVAVSRSRGIVRPVSLSYNEYGAELSAKSSRFWGHEDADIFWYDPHLSPEEEKRILAIGDPRRRAEEAYQLARLMSGEELRVCAMQALGVRDKEAA